MRQAQIKIPAELFAIAESSHFEGELALPLLEAGPDDFKFEKPISWSVEVTNTGSALLVDGLAQGEAICACARCLEDVSYDLNGHIEGYFLVNGEYASDADDDDDDIGEDEFDVLPADHVIDLEPYIRAALMVDAPTMPLCSENCAGLCPICGSNLNEGACGCGPDEALEEFERAANPFAALADFKFE